MPTFEISYYDDKDEICTERCEANDPNAAKRNFFMALAEAAEEETLEEGAEPINFNAFRVNTVKLVEPSDEPVADVADTGDGDGDDSEGAPV